MFGSFLMSVWEIVLDQPPEEKFTNDARLVRHRVASKSWSTHVVSIFVPWCWLRGSIYSSGQRACPQGCSIAALSLSRWDTTRLVASLDRLVVLLRDPKLVWRSWSIAGPHWLALSRTTWCTLQGLGSGLSPQSTHCACVRTGA